MRPERRHDEAGFEEEDLAGGRRVRIVYRPLSRRSGEPLHGRSDRWRLHRRKNGHAVWSGALSSSATGRMPRRVRLGATGFLILVVLLLAGVPPLSAQGSAGVAGITATASSCAYLRLKNAPNWVVSGAWRGPHNLTLIDAFRSQIVDYAINPRSAAAVPREIARDMRNQKPQRIQAGGAGGPNMYIEFAGNRFRAVDEKLDFVGQRAETIVDSSVKSNGFTVAGVLDWQIADGDFVAYATFVSTAAAGDEKAWSDLENWSTGFVRYPYGQPWRVEFFRLAKFSNPNTVLYRLGYPMLAAVGKDVYALVVENDTPILYRFRKGQKPEPLANTFPREIANRQIPALPNFVNYWDYPLVMRAVEDSVMPAGLYGWNGSLFLLYRIPEPKGTRWMIAKLVNGQFIEPSRLPTRADNVTLIPGPEYWALLEKGPIQELGTQKLEQAILIPSQKFSGNVQIPLCN
jgi:hypothetical protein